MGIDTSSLIKTLNSTSVNALEKAAALCQSKSNQTVELEHWLLQLLDQDDHDVAKLIRQFEINRSELQADLEQAINRFRTGFDRTPSLSMMIGELIQEAWVLASIQFKEPKVRTGTLLMGLRTNDQLARAARAISPELNKLKVEPLWSELLTIVQGSVEDAEAARARVEAGGTSGSTSRSKAEGTQTPGLDQYTNNLTELARQNRIDPVLGRDFEIRQLIDILIRRRQNNPILTGEAGVGKTAIVEGFARRIAAGDVPEVLRDVEIRALDLGLLQAGAGVKGEFENRLKQVITEVKASPKPIILFIDEAHTMIGAGGQAGQSDAANLLKPALARGELRTIAATTWAEYKKYFEKDAALARRFQVIKVEEPDEATAIRMMRGIIEKQEAHHGVRILEEAIEAAVQLSARYLTGRQLPDKSVSLLDTACARVKTSQDATPAQVEDKRRLIEALETELALLEREVATGAAHSDRTEEIRTELARVETELAESEAQCEVERSLALKIREIGSQIENCRKESLEHPDLEGLRSQFQEQQAELERIQGESPMVQVSVNAQTVAEVVAGWTGIPVGKMLTDEIQAVLNLKDRLEERVIGQSDAIELISRRVQTARADLTDPRRPIGVFLLVGPSGVGKSETALALADSLYGGERNLVVINMSEFQQDYTVSTLKGSPPGLVGYGEGGVLTEAVRRKPYSVVLLDEIEKAHPKVMELFYQVFDKGMMEDSEGREIDFKNTVILLTSNTASDKIMKLMADPETAPGSAALARAIRPELLEVFKPAFLGRLDVVPYFPIADSALRTIIRIQLDRVGARLRTNHQAEFHYDDAVVESIASRCTEVESGARNIDHIINRTLLPEMSGECLARMASGEPLKEVTISIDEEGEFRYSLV